MANNSPMLDEAQIAHLEERMAKLQRSTRATIPAMVPMHDILRQKFRWYYNWHLNIWSKTVHALVLLLYIGLTSAFLYSSVFTQARMVMASSKKVWSSESDWAAWKMDKLSTSVRKGSITLAATIIQPIEVTPTEVTPTEPAAPAETVTPSGSEESPDSLPQAPQNDTPEIPATTPETPAVETPPAETSSGETPVTPEVQGVSSARIAQAETPPVDPASAADTDTTANSEVVATPESQVPASQTPVEEPAALVATTEYAPEGIAVTTFTPYQDEVVKWMGLESEEILNNQTIIKEFSTDNVLWSNNLAELPDSKTLYIKLTLKTTDKNTTPAVSSLAVNYSRLPLTPITILPNEGDTIDNANPILTTAPFQDLDNDLHYASRWQVTTKSSQYSSSKIDTGDDRRSLTSYRLKKLDKGTYYWRVKFQDNTGAWSPWSKEASFTVKEDITPNDIESERTESTKTYNNLNGSKTLESYSGVIHYKDDYNDPKAQWKDINPDHMVDNSDYVLFDQMPSTVKVYKDKIGYEIESRKTGKKFQVVLEEAPGAQTVPSDVVEVNNVSIEDGAIAQDESPAPINSPPTENSAETIAPSGGEEFQPTGDSSVPSALQDDSQPQSMIETAKLLAKSVDMVGVADAQETVLSGQNLDFDFEISEYGVRLWKTIKGPNAPRNFKWKITQTGSGDDLKFRDNPEAFETKGAKNEVDVATNKIKINNSSFYWQETAPKSDLKIDTDVYYSGVGDGQVTGANTALSCVPTWAAAQTATTGTPETSGGFVQSKKQISEGNCTTTINRMFLPFNTSGLPDDAMISAATLSVWAVGVSDGVDDGTDLIGVTQTSQADNTSLTGDDYDNNGDSVTNPTLGATSRDITDIASGSYADFTLNATGLGWISKTDYTLLGLREGHDYTNTNISADIQVGISFSTSETPDTSQDPILAITYTTGITISGHVYTAEDKLSNVGAGINVAVSVNGAASANSDDTDADGFFEITGVTVAANNTITLYVNDEAVEANLITQAVDGVTNITGLEMYTDKIVLTHETAGPMTNALLDVANNSADDDIHFADTAAFDTAYELFIQTTKTYTPGGTVTSTGDIDINGTFVPGANTINVYGSWDATGGTLTNTGSTITFKATATGKTILDGGNNWNNVTFNGSGGGWSFSDTTILAGDLTVTLGTLSGTNDITLNGGDVTGNGTISLTGGIFLLDTTGNFGGDTAWTFYNLTFGDGAGATVTAKTGTGSITTTNVLTIALNQTLNAGDDTWTLSGTTGTPFVKNGTFTPTSSTFIFSGDNAGGNTNIPATTYNHLTVNNVAGVETYATAGAIVLNGNFTQEAGSFDASAGDMTVAGFVIKSGTYTAPAGTLITANLFDRWAAATFDANGGTVEIRAHATYTVTTNNLTFYNLIFNKTSVNASYIISLVDSFTVANNLTVKNQDNTYNASIRAVSGTPTVTVNGNFVNESTAENGIISWGSGTAATNFTTVVKGNVSFFDTNNAVNIYANFTLNSNTADQSINDTAGAVINYGVWTVDKSGFALNLATDFIQDNTTPAGFVLTSGTINQSTFAMTTRYFTMTTGTVNGGVADFRVLWDYTQNGGTFNGSSGNNSYLNMTINAGSYTSSSNNTNTRDFTRAGVATFDANGGTYIMWGDNATTRITPNNCTFNNVTIQRSVTGDIDHFIAGDFTIAGDLVVANINSAAGMYTIRGDNGVYPTITVNGKFEIASSAQTGDITFGSSTSSYNLTVAVKGNVSLLDSNNTVRAYAHFTLNSDTADQTIDNTGAATINYGTWTINKGSYSAILATAATIGSSGALVVSGGKIDLAGNDLTMSGGTGDATISSGATLRVKGKETYTTPTLNSGSIVEYYGYGVAEDITIKDNGAADYHHLIINDANATKATYITAADLNIAGDFNISAGNFVSFGSETTTTVLGTWNVSGAEGSLVTLGRSGGVDPAQWNINPTAWAVDYVNVTDSENIAVAKIDPVHYEVTNNPDNNTNWFTITGITISGTCDKYDESTNCADSETVKVAVNGSISGQTGTTSGGSWSISNVLVSSGDVVTVWVDGVADALEANAVTKYDGTGDITGVLLYEDHLTIGSADNQDLSNTNLSQYDNSVSTDEDIFFDVDAGNLIVDDTAQSAREELFILASNTLTPGGNITTFSIDINGTFVPEANTVDVAGNWDATGGAFTNTNSTITFSATSAGKTITSDTKAFNNLTFDGVGGTWTLQDALNVDGNIDFTNGIVDSNTNQINVAGNWTKGTGSFTHNNNTVIFDGAGGSTQVVTGDTIFNHLNLTQTDGARTVQFAGNSTTRVLGTWTVSGALGKIITLQSSDLNNWNINPTAWSVAYVAVSRSTNQAVAKIDPTNSTDGGSNVNWFTYFTITSSAGSNGTINPLGESQKMTGENQSYTITPTEGYYIAEIIVDGTSITGVLSSPYTFINIIADHTISVSFIADNTIIWDGGDADDDNWSSPDNWTGNTKPTASDDVIFNNTSDDNSTLDALFANHIKSLSVNAGYDGTITAANDLDIDNDVTLASGTIDGSASHYTFNTAGSWTNTGTTFTANKPSVNFNGATVGGTITTGGESFYDMTVAGVDGNWIYRKTITINNTTGSILTDYQVPMTIDTSDLTGKLQAQCEDLRFTPTDSETPYAYWYQEGCLTTSTRVYIKIPSLPAGESDIYMYYGNATATSKSSGEDTFIAFEDFSSTPAITLTSLNRLATFGFTFPATNQYVLEQKYMATSFDGDRWGGITQFLGAINVKNTFVDTYDTDDAASLPAIRSMDGSWFQTTAGTTYEQKFVRNQLSSALYLNGNQVSTSVSGNLNNQSTYPIQIWAGGGAMPSTVVQYDSTNNRLLINNYRSATAYIYSWIDDVRLRVYASSEPAVSAIGAEIPMVQILGSDWTLQDDLDVSNVLTITSGTLTAGANDVTTLDYSQGGGTFSASTSANAMNVSGNFAHSAGSFAHNSGTVNLTGAGATTQEISGNTTFNNLNLTETAARAVQFAGNSTTTVSGTWTVSGAAGKIITLQSSDLNNWNINPTAWSVTYVTVSRSTNQAVARINPSNSTDGGSNVNWFAAASSTYTITASAGAGGTISPDGAVAVEDGADKSFTITAEDGYHIASVSVDGVSQGAIATYTFDNVTTTHTIAASFEANPTSIDNPTNFTGIAGDTIANLSWTNPSSIYFTHCTLYRSTEADVVGTTVADNLNTETVYNDANLTNGTIYYYTLKAYDSFGNISSGVQVFLTPNQLIDIIAPSAPSNLRLITVTQVSADVAWDAATDNIGVTGYIVYNVDTGLQVGATSNTTYTFSNLTPDTVYNWVVRAYDGAGNLSEQSNILNTRTKVDSGGDDYICVGPDCEATCTGPDCDGNTCVGPDCTRTCTGPDCKKPGGVATYLILSNVPAKVTVGQPLSSKIKVMAVDGGGGVIKGYTGSIHFTSTDAKAVFGWTQNNAYVFTPVDGGVHEFEGNDFRFETVGEQKLTVSDNKVSASATIMVEGALSVIPQVFQKAQDRISNFVKDDGSKVNTAAIVTTTALLAPPLIINSMIGLGNLWSQLAYWLMQSAQFLGLRRRRKPWGVVFDSENGLPISFATVKIVDKEYNRVIEMAVTDQEGRFGFLVKPGMFHMIVKKGGYLFPSSHKASSFYHDVYGSGNIEIKKNEAITLNIPVDPQEKASVGFRMSVLLLKTSKLFNLIRLPMLAFGIIFAIVMIIVSYDALYLLSLGFYGLILVRDYIRSFRARPFGVVTDVFGHPLDATIVRVYEKKTNRLVGTDVTDDIGRFRFLVYPGVYYVSATKPGYSEFRSHLMYLEKERTTVSINVKMKKIGK